MEALSVLEYHHRVGRGRLENTLIETSGSNNLLKVIHELFGANISKNMVKINASNDDYDISGYICKPCVLKSNRNFMITIVNGRVVKNAEVNKTINDAYYTYKPDIKYPVVVLKIETDPTLIDVNIHPTKQDIKFSKIDSLTSLITSTIKDALYNSLLVPNVEVKESKQINIPIQTVSEVDKSFNNDSEEDYVIEETPLFINDSINDNPSEKEQVTMDFKVNEKNEVICVQ